jgi:hypothetical protein
MTTAKSKDRCTLILDDESVVRLLGRIERQARLDPMIMGLSSDAAMTVRGDIRTLGWLLRSCPDFMTPSEARTMLLELRKRYLDVPSEFRDLIDQAISEIERFPIERFSEAPEAARCWASP